MKIELKELSKNYNRSKIFSKLTTTFEYPNAYVIQGANGSGKSTLLSIISGYQTQTEGLINYTINNKDIASEMLHEHISIVAPYIDLHDDLTLEETICFHSNFKTFYNNLSINKVVEILNLTKNTNKQLKDFSTGMKQRVKLGLAILSNTPFLFLDEPTMNLDAKNIEWYSNLINEYKKNRLIIVASNNQTKEYGFCNSTLNIEDYK